MKMKNDKKTEKNDSVARFFNFEKPEGPRRPH